jgi:hypothetical protein
VSWLEDIHLRDLDDSTIIEATRRFYPPSGFHSVKGSLPPVWWYPSHNRLPAGA